MPVSFLIKLQGPGLNTFFKNTFLKNFILDVRLGSEYRLFSKLFRLFFHMKTNIQGDLQVCITVSLITIKILFTYINR